MSIARTLSLVARDLRLGPRSPVFLGIFVMPLLVTFLVQVVFLRISEPALGRPRLGIAEADRSEITAAVKRMDGVSLTLAGGAEELRRLVEDHDVDVGLVLPEGFDAAVRAGERPELGVYVSGESLMSSRILLAVTVFDLVREIEDAAAPVDVVLNTVGEGNALPLEKLFVLFLAVWVLVALGMFLPAFMLVGEREAGTLGAVLVSPATMSEVLLSKAILGLLMAIPMAYITLVLNQALPARPAALLATLAVAAVICIEIGLIYGTVAPDAKTLFTLMKTLNVFILAPIIFFVFPEWPRWIAMLFPTYWFMKPLHDIALKSAAFADVWPDLAGALGIAAALMVPIALLGHRMQKKLASS